MKQPSNRQIKTDESGREIAFFFPKAQPPVTVHARNREEAEDKLAAPNKKEHE